MAGPIPSTSCFAALSMSAMFVMMVMTRATIEVQYRVQVTCVNETEAAKTGVVDDYKALDADFYMTQLCFDTDCTPYKSVSDYPAARSSRNNFDTALAFAILTCIGLAASTLTLFLGYSSPRFHTRRTARLATTLVVFCIFTAAMTIIAVESSEGYDVEEYKDTFFEQLCSPHSLETREALLGLGLGLFRFFLWPTLILATCIMFPGCGGVCDSCVSAPTGLRVVPAGHHHIRDAGSASVIPIVAVAADPSGIQRHGSGPGIIVPASAAPAVGAEQATITPTMEVVPHDMQPASSESTGVMAFAVPMHYPPVSANRSDFGPPQQPV